MLKKKILSILVVTILLLGVTIFPMNGSAETELKVGAWLGEQPTDAGVKAFNQLQNRNLDIVHMYMDWSTNFNSIRTNVDSAYSNNATILITWEPWEYDTVQIMNGNADNYLKRMAQDMKSYGKEIWLRPLHEANGDWYPWAIGYKSGNNTNSTYIAAFRHIVDVFRSEGANNIKWIFTLNCDNVGPNTSFEGIYPGDNYVDYNSIDGYNWGTTQSWGSTWNTFDQIFSRSYNSLKNYNKPIFIAEWASAEIGGNKAQWITDSFNTIRSSYPKIFAAVWFSHNKETDWRINSSEAVLNAYKNAIKKTSSTPTATASTPTPTISTHTPTTTSSLPASNGYPYGIKSLATDQNEANAMLLREWEDWKNSRITTSGAGGYRRVQTSGSQDFTTCSEGMGYGMLLSVYFNERELFDDLYSYAKKYFNSTGLMDWSIGADGKVAGTGAATDGDEDMATALVFAHKKWGSSGKINYEQEAKTYINNLYRYCVEPGTYVLKPGNWGGSDALNPCYFVPAWYRIYADFTGNNDWLKVADKSYEILDQIGKFNNNTGLVPDWCKADGTEQKLTVWNGASKYEYSYDAARMPWRIALDYSWYGTEKAKAYCDKVSAFFKNVGAENIVDGYSITGQKIGQYHNATFVCTAAAGTLTGGDLDFGQKMFNESVKVKDSAPHDYYGNSLRMLTLLYMSGNFQNLYNDSPSPATPTPSSNKYVIGDLNGDNSFNSIDFGYLRMYLLGMISSFPSEYGMLAADVDGNGQINSVDFAYMRQVLIGMKSEFPRKN